MSKTSRRTNRQQIPITRYFLFSQFFLSILINFSCDIIIRRLYNHSRDRIFRNDACYKAFIERGKGAFAYCWQLNKTPFVLQGIITRASKVP